MIHIFKNFKQQDIKGSELFLLMDNPPLSLEANFNIKNSFRVELHFSKYYVVCTKSKYTVYDRDHKVLFTTSFKKYYSTTDPILECVFVAYKCTYIDWICIPIEDVEGGQATGHN